MKKYIITLLVVIACVVFSTALIANAASDVNEVKDNNSVSQLQSTKSDVDGLKDAFDTARVDNEDLAAAIEFAKSVESIDNSTVTTESQLSSIHTLQVVQLVVSSITCAVVIGLGIIFIVNMRGNKNTFKN